MRNFILGTDWWSDCDDAVALRIITRSIKAEKINLLGIGINAAMEHSAASLKGFLSADGIDGIPIGIDRSATGFKGKTAYQKRLAENFAPGLTNDDFPDAKRLYRTLLANSDGPIEIIEIGFLQVLRDVLLSEPDDISELSGLELFEKKVSKVWIMAGKWDDDGGLEHNFCLNELTSLAGSEVCKTCPSPITFLGWEVGFDVITGGELLPSDHLKLVLDDHGSYNGRSSWDPMLALLAVIGDEKQAGYNTVTGTAEVERGTGANHFTPSENGKHKFVIKAESNDFYEKMINGIIK